MRLYGLNPPIPHIFPASGDFQPVTGTYIQAEPSAADTIEVISLKRYLDADHNELVNSVLDSYRAAIAAASDFGAQACPHVAPQFQADLMRLQQRIGHKVTPSIVSETQQQVEDQLKKWGGRTAAYFKQKAGEVKELMLVLANTAEAVGERDHRYALQFADFSAQLTKIADLDDITRVRASIIESAQQMKACVESMAQDSRRAVELMRAEVAGYQAKLEETERFATRDLVTGLDNRRRVETELERLIALGRTFSLLMFDLNDFKKVNDQLGHLAGDELLKQFSKELKAVFRPSDTVGRWGGDEFVVLLDCSLDKANARLEQVRNWVFGEYTLTVAAASYKVKVSAAAGGVAWQRGETVQHLIERADAAMYRDKRARGHG